jgi:PadR family transcriptional regulator, regulatory protein PadR
VSEQISQQWATSINKKLFKGVVLETVLLNLINGEPQNGLHGYAIFMAIKRKFAVNLGPSTLYHELKLLETRGFVKSFWGDFDGRPSKKYKITDKGQSLLQLYFAELKVLIPSSAFYRGQIHSK